MHTLLNGNNKHEESKTAQATGKTEFNREATLLAQGNLIFILKPKQNNNNNGNKNNFSKHGWKKFKMFFFFFF